MSFNKYSEVAMSDRSAVDSLAAKLGSLSSELSEAENSALIGLLNAAATTAWASRLAGGRELIAEDPEFSVLDEINASVANAEDSQQGVTRSSPVCIVGATTTITTIASHPAIGCGGGGGGGANGPGPAPQYSPYPTCMGG